MPKGINLSEVLTSPFCRKSVNGHRHGYLKKSVSTDFGSMCRKLMTGWDINKILDPILPDLIEEFGDTNIIVTPKSSQPLNDKLADYFSKKVVKGTSPLFYLKKTTFSVPELRGWWEILKDMTPPHVRNPRIYHPHLSAIFNLKSPYKFKMHHIPVKYRGVLDRLRRDKGFNLFDSLEVGLEGKNVLIIDDTFSEKKTTLKMAVDRVSQKTPKSIKAFSLLREKTTLMDNYKSSGEVENKERSIWTASFLDVFSGGFLEKIKGSKALISIVSPEFPEYSLPFSGETLFLRFNDERVLYDMEDPQFSRFNGDHYSAIKRFMIKNQNADNVVIQCEAGKSRSAAIAKGISEKFGGKLFLRYTPKKMNNKIYKKFMRYV
jgi:hypothetical protein